MERYTSLQRMESGVYAAGAPVAIVAGALLKDNQKGGVAVQLKLLNLSQKTIAAMSLSVNARDVSGAELGKTERQYLDLFAEPGKAFGQNKAIRMESDATRLFTPSVAGVVFADGTRWEAGPETAWVPLPAQRPLDAALPQERLREQYVRETGAAYAPQTAQGIWVCCCGNLNGDAHQACNACGLARETVFGALELAHLEEGSRAQQLLDAEKSKREAEHQRKVRTVAIVCSAAAVGLVAAAFLLNRFVLAPARAYQQGVTLMEAEKYDDAIETFTGLGTYRDAEEKLAQIDELLLEEQYQSALALLAQERYDEAAEAFGQLAGYRDCELRIAEANAAAAEQQYNAACEALRSGYIDGAIALFTQLGDYKDSQNMILRGRFLLLEALCAQEDYETAAPLISELYPHEEYRERLARPMLAAAQHMTKSGQYEQAAGYLAQLAASAPGPLSADVDFATAELAYAKGEYEAAADLYVSLLEQREEAKERLYACYQQLSASGSKSDKLKEYRSHIGDIKLDVTLENLQGSWVYDEGTTDIDDGLAMRYKYGFQVKGDEIISWYEGTPTPFDEELYFHYTGRVKLSGNTISDTGFSTDCVILELTPEYFTAKYEYVRCKFRRAD